jgi:HlyD family secretion protein
MEKMRGFSAWEAIRMNYESSFAREATAVDYTAGDNIPVTERRPAPRRRIVPILLGLLVIAAILVGAWYAFGGNKPLADKAATAKTASAEKGDSKEAPNVTVISPGRQTVANIVTATGTLAARRDMPIGAVGEGGLVTHVLVEPGQWVRAGQVLAVVDRQVQAQQSNQILAQIRVAEVDVRLAQTELDRAAALVARGFVSRADIDRKTAQRDAARARLGVTRAQFAENGARVRRLDIRSPSDGYVLDRKVEPGQVVGAGTSMLFRIAQGGDLELHAQLSESDLAHAAVGYRAMVTPVGSDRSFAGRIWQISPVIDPQSRQGMVKISLPYDRALRPGGFASAKIDSGSIEAPLLPESAVQSDAKGNYVYVIEPDNKVARRDVTVGTINEQGVSILAGLSGTEQVVERAGGFLNIGEKVVPKRNVAAR